MTSLVKGRNQVSFKSLDESEFQCGIGPFKGAFLQRLANAKVFLVFYCALGILQGAYFTYSVGIVSTIEKRFAFDSKASGLILIADNLSPIVTSLLIGFYGGQAHRPRIIGVGMMIVVVSCFLSASPYFIFGPGLHLLTQEIGPSNETMCRVDQLQEDKCETGQKGHSTTLTAVVLFFIGSFFSGFGGSAYYTAGIAYMDDNVRKENTASYFSLSMAIRLVGPSLGFALSSFCLSYFESPYLSPDLPLTDPRWVGAWWMGFVILGIFLFFFSIPMFFFPRKLRRTPGEVVEKSPEDEKLPKLKDMPKSLMKLMRNGIYVCHTLGIVFHLNGILGYFILMPRFMEAHFHKSASKASVVSGASSILSMLVGIIAGGYFIRRYKPRPRFLTGYMVFVHLFTMAAFLTVMFFSCEPIKMFHPKLPDGSLSLVNPCNEDCGCGTQVFQPICGPDSETHFFSPCHAGCTGINFKNSTTKIFSGCQCSSSSEELFTDGLCPYSCNVFLIYILVLASAKLISSTGSVGNMIISLRCIDPKDKTLAVGVVGCVISAFAFIPHPLIFGALADSACIIWEESCGKTGNCWLYDVDKLRFILHGACVAFMAVGTVFDFLVFLLSNRLKNFYEDLPQDDPDKSHSALAATMIVNDDDDEEVHLYTKPKISLGNSYNNINSGL